MEPNIKNLVKLRDYMASGEWKKKGRFNMLYNWNCLFRGRPCGCLMGHAHFSYLFLDYHDIYGNSIDIQSCFGIQICSSLWDFLFSAKWKNYDNTPEGAIGRIDAVIDGLRF